MLFHSFRNKAILCIYPKISDNLLFAFWAAVAVLFGMSVRFLPKEDIALFAPYLNFSETSKVNRP